MTGPHVETTAQTHLTERVAGTDWTAVETELGGVGCALTGPLLTPEETAEFADMYTDDSRFRSTVNMGRHRFGEGEYRYFGDPLPKPIIELKQALYPRLLPIARDWWTKLRRETPWPDSFDEWLDMCHAAGQSRTTPILFKYDQGDWNALHRDLYGDRVFPFQIVINLSRHGKDYEGGEFVLYEQRPRAQSRATAVTIPHGHGLVFTTRDKPVQSVGGWSTGPVRHGVSLIRSGTRMSLALLFHDAT